MRKMDKKRPVYTVFAVLVDMLILIAIIAVLRTDIFGLKDWIGPPALRAGGITLILVAVAGFIVVNTRLVTVIYGAKKQVMLTGGRAIDKEDYRSTLLRFRSGNRELMAMVRQVVEQLDEILRKKELLAQILARNGITENGEYMQARDTTEGIIYSNIRGMLNRLDLWDDDESKNPSRAGVYRDHLDYIRRVIDANEKLLVKTDIFLTSISKADTSITDSDVNLEIFTKTLDDLNNKEDGLRI